MAECNTESHAELCGKKKPSFYKVSVKNHSGQWIVKACSLGMRNAFAIAKELKQLGIEARAKKHSYGVKNEN